tara:strand:- start:2689 stop:3408 length:720 start_codon:yes stop_codon:yes gene_type:complete
MIKEFKIEIPETLTVGHYQKFGTLDHLTQTKRIVRIVSAIANRDESEVENWPLTSVFQIYKDLNERLEDIQSIFLPIFEWRGTTYGFQPIHKMSVGEFIDMEARLQNGIDSMHELLAILYRPIKSNKFDGLEWKIKSNVKYALGKSESLFKYYELEDYDTEKRDWRAELFKEFPLPMGLGAYNFFLFVGMELSKDFQTSFQKSVKNLTKKEKKELSQLLNTMDGSQPYITWLKKEASSD